MLRITSFAILGTLLEAGFLVGSVAGAQEINPKIEKQSPSPQPLSPEYRGEGALNRFSHREILGPRGGAGQQSIFAHLHQVAFTRDGALMAAGAGGTIFVWKVADGKDPHRTWRQLRFLFLGLRRFLRKKRDGHEDGEAKEARQVHARFPIRPRRGEASGTM